MKRSFGGLYRLLNRLLEAARPAADGEETDAAGAEVRGRDLYHARRIGVAALGAGCWDGVQAQGRLLFSVRTRRLSDASRGRDERDDNGQDIRNQVYAGYPQNRSALDFQQLQSAFQIGQRWGQFHKSRPFELERRSVSLTGF
jgi:hypothetical protein